LEKDTNRTGSEKEERTTFEKIWQQADDDILFYRAKEPYKSEGKRETFPKNQNSAHGVYD